MTVPAQVLAAVRSIPHPRQEPDMPAPEPSPAEPTGELRAALARKLSTWVIGVAHENSWNCADALLSGPLADVVQEAAEADKRLDALIDVRAERDALLAKLRAVEAEIAEEEAHRASLPAWEISVLVPTEAGDEMADRIFDAVANAAYETQPDDREDWDIFVSASKNPTYVMTHLLRRALDGS